MNRGTAGVVSSLSNYADGIETHTVHQINIPANGWWHAYEASLWRFDFSQGYQIQFR